MHEHLKQDVFDVEKNFEVFSYIHTNKHTGRVTYNSSKGASTTQLKL